MNFAVELVVESLIIETQFRKLYKLQISQKLRVVVNFGVHKLSNAKTESFINSVDVASHMIPQKLSFKLVVQSELRSMS